MCVGNIPSCHAIVAQAMHLRGKTIQSRMEALQLRVLLMEAFLMSFNTNFLPNSFRSHTSMAQPATKLFEFSTSNNTESYIVAYEQRNNKMCFISSVGFISMRSNC